MVKMSILNVVELYFLLIEWAATREAWFDVVHVTWQKLLDMIKKKSICVLIVIFHLHIPLLYLTTTMLDFGHLQ